MNTDSMQRLLTSQARLFEHAHTDSMELKPLGFKIKKEGFRLGAYYCNPDFLLLPFSNCEQLAAFNKDQKSILSALFFAFAYAEIASSETLALTYNIAVAKKIFDIYSDEYMILFHETAEETDHIITFCAVCKGILGRTDIVGPHNYGHLKPVYSAFDAFESKLCKHGYGAMYLFMRYLLNLALKQLESFMGQGVSEENRHRVAHEIIVGHATDEARHTTTSLQLGYEFYQRADKSSRALVKSLLKQSIYTMIDMRFGNPYQHYQHHLAKRVLQEAWKRPEFAESSLRFDELPELWQRQNLIIEPSPEYLSSQRWLSQQIARLLEMLECSLPIRNEKFAEFIELSNSKCAA
ncbi:MAG TPA: hypothetical protein VGK97_09475 [Spongiibacteraceae bacterium]